MRILCLIPVFSFFCCYALAQNVGIGTTTPIAPLHINTTLQVPAIIGGGNNLYVPILENGEYRGYFGSFAGAAPDVDFGTGSTNNSGKLHFTIKAVPKLTIAANGRVGIGTTDPQEALHIAEGTIRIPFLAGATNRVVRVNFLGQLQAGDQLGSLVIPFAAFDKEDGTTSSSVILSPLGVYVTSGASDILYAPVYLRHGSRLTSMSMTFVDNSANNLQLDLVQYNHLTNFSIVVGTLSTTGFPSSVSPATVTLNIAPNHTIDYSLNGYYLRLRPIGGSNTWTGSTLRMRSAQFNYLYEF